MKLFPLLPVGCPRRKRSGFTLVEMVFAVGIYTFIMVGVVVAIQIFALRIYTLGATKLVATQGTRKALNQIRDDIRGGKLLQVGTTDNAGNFTPVNVANGAVGNGLQIFETTNQAPPFSIYYLQTNTVGGMSSNVLWWISVSANYASTNLINLACYITNLDVFSAEDWDNWPAAGITNNNMINNQVYAVKLQFYQWEYPIAVVGGAGLNSYDYYQIRTRVCRRATD
jgi:type II secretory pathway pseudopilin PulG